MHSIYGSGRDYGRCDAFNGIEPPVREHCGRVVCRTTPRHDASSARRSGVVEYADADTLRRGGAASDSRQELFPCERVLQSCPAELIREIATDVETKCLDGPRQAVADWRVRHTQPSLGLRLLR